ncbi:hypothetical protein D3C77_456800 [compost metagenome]
MAINHQETADVCDQCNYANSHHQHGLRFAAVEGTSSHFHEHAQSQNQLQNARQVGSPDLKLCTPPDRKESKPIDGSISKHVQRVGNQASRLSDQTCSHLDDKHRGVDTEQDLQRACLFRSSQLFIGTIC